MADQECSAIPVYGRQRSELRASLSIADDTDAEVWKIIDGFPDYEVSDLGRVRSRRERSARTDATVVAMKTARAEGASLAGLSRMFGMDRRTAARLLREHSLVPTAFILKPSRMKTGRRGYLLVTVYSDHGKKRDTVHRIVATAFVPNPRNLATVNHIDGNSLNNRASNLEWCTQGDNVRHAIRTGLSNPRAAAIKGAEARWRPKA